MAFHVLAVHGQFSVQRNFHCGEDRLHLARLDSLDLRREDRGLVLSVREHEFRHANPGPDWETESKAHRECEKNDECFLHVTPMIVAELPVSSLRDAARGLPTGCRKTPRSQAIDWEESPAPRAQALQSGRR